MKVTSRIRRHYRLRKKIKGSKDRPRLAVFRSSRHIYAQIIDDNVGKTLIYESDLKISQKGSKKSNAFEIGKSIAQKAIKKGIKEIVFDRGGFLYHGRVEELAKGAREGGLKF